MMNSRPEIDFDGLREACSETALYGHLGDLARRLGFDHFVYLSLGEYGRKLDMLINGYPVAWSERYAQNNYLAVDPVLQHCLRSVTPLVWHPGAFRAEQDQVFLGEAGEFGVKSGISFSVRGNGGGVSILSFASDSVSNETLRFTQNSLAVGQLVSCYMHEASERLMAQRGGREEVQLSAREKECLKWAASGKSNWQIGRLMDISEHGVGFHFRKIFSKLGVRTRQQAIVRAMLLGIF